MPNLLEQKLKIIPLGGLEEIGKNMMLIEYDQDIIIIDMGFMFPSEEMLGIDYVIPNIKYLQENQKKIKAIIITHGHLDHTGGIPYIINRIGYPPIFGTKLTCGLIKERLSEFKKINKVDIYEFDPKDKLQFGVFSVEFFRVNHNIPDGVGVAVTCPEGLLVHTGDFKFDHTPQDQKPTDFAKIAELSSRNVIAAFSDSTNAEDQGYAIPEKEIEDHIDDILDDTKGRVIVATFSSLISRIQQVINVSISHGRKIAFSGLSMEKTVATAKELGYLKIPSEWIIPLKKANSTPDEKLTIIATGSQGEDSSALSRMSRGEHRDIKIKPGDTVILSSSAIPGNERSIHTVMDNLFREGAHVVYKKVLDVHTGGHGRQEDLKLMLSLLRPKYFIPIHGEHHMLVRHAKLATDIGIPQENIFIMDNGEVLEIKDGRAIINKKKISVGYTLVDGLGVGDIGNVVLRDRQVLSEDGMVVVILQVSKNNGKLLRDPDIISRGFVYMKESTHLIYSIRNVVKKIFKSQKNNRALDSADLKARVRDRLGSFIYKKTERRPMILPVVIEV
ncbi:ribonuclease J [bacterium (Candidatus Torokbacteria) CG_4_10_14_0_2_um_filter_35_8]|nr:MAG: ribonuclease J [bacterium (Candidatus Torokbacteria) CG_4_10_14_0_2_um_filter_35_8]